MPLFFITVQSALLAIAIYLLVQVRLYGPISSALGDYDRWLSINLVGGDEISLLFVVLTCFLFLAMLVFNYHKHYMNPLFLFLFLVLEGLINAIFLSYDLFDLYALVEVSTITVSILIMFKRDSQSIYDGMVYLLTNLVSMTFFVLGIGYVYKLFGSLDLLVIKDSMDSVVDTRQLILPYSLLITAIGLKSASCLFFPGFQELMVHQLLLQLSRPSFQVCTSKVVSIFSLDFKTPFQASLIPQIFS